MPYFSLILPIYNVAPYLGRCIDSILNQIFSDYEIILVDDGSTDESLSICRRYAGQYSKIIVLHKANGGLSSARNFGLNKASGKYIFWIDPDDWIEPDSLRILYEATVEKSPNIVKFNFTRKPENCSVKTVIPYDLYSKERIRKEIFPVALEKTGLINFSVWSHVYRKDFLDCNKIIFVSEKEIGSEDYLFNWQAYLLADSILVIDECLYNYDLRDGSLSQKYRENLITQYHKLHNMLRNFLEQNDLFNTYRESYAVSYVNKALGICMKNECFTITRRTLLQRWLKCKKMLSDQELENALKNYPVCKISIKEKTKIWLMKHKSALPLMVLFIRNRRKR